MKTGLSIAIPAGTYARVAPRSGLAVKHFIDTGAGVVDEDYRGEVGVVLFNHSDVDFQSMITLAYPEKALPGPHDSTNSWLAFCCHLMVSAPASGPQLSLAIQDYPMITSPAQVAWASRPTKDCQNLL